MSAGKAFVWMDRYLDTTRLGPMFLKLPKVADLILETLGRGCEKGLYDSRAFVAIGNRVHVLIRQRQQASKVLQWLKETTAREANLIFARAGQPFWQHKSYDHWARDGPAVERIVAYIENNPVRAGLAAEHPLYRWSSAWRGDGEPKFAAAR
ncbi:MAG: transposase [Bryobacteraceae bacterium]|jgi:REP element-mobilizing transposase RayT